VVPKFNPHNTEEIFQCLEKTLSEGWSKKKQEAGLAYAAEFDWNRTARQTLDIYERTAGL
jgi:glycosyltransferase involved in cell wall biosynthesis